MSFANRYGFFDRLLHRVAFWTRFAQLGVADMEERMFARELEQIEPGPPVFITALPRAGTTILLELIAGLPEFAAHTYREMPFVLTPLLWRKFAGKSKTADEPRERAHGDGIQVTLDSPEAFEEIVWMRFWKKHYRTDRIIPWSNCDDAEFQEFFSTHRKKIVALRKRDKPSAYRYVSKNNQNVARLPCLADCANGSSTVLVAVREPLQHAASLLRQHQRFTEMHRADGFARRYMAGIGHFDFGDNLKPIDFDSWLDTRGQALDSNTLAFWLEYWLATYRHVADVATSRDNIHVVAFETLGGATTLRPLSERLGVDLEQLDGQLGRLRVAKQHVTDEPTDDAQRRRIAEATEIYRTLAADSVLAHA